MFCRFSASVLEGHHFFHTFSIEIAERVGASHWQILNVFGADLNGCNQQAEEHDEVNRKLRREADR